MYLSLAKIHRRPTLTKHSYHNTLILATFYPCFIHSYLTITKAPFIHHDTHLLITMHILSLSTSFVALAGISQALRTVPSSPCADRCGDITNTTSSEIVCKDIDYNTPTGRLFEECITCQLGSNATDPSTGDSDLKWLLCEKS